MALLIDLFGFLSVVLAGFARTAQLVTFGTVIFSVFILGRTRHLSDERTLHHRINQCARFASLCFMAILSLELVVHIAALHGSLALDLVDSITDRFAIILLAKILVVLGLYTALALRGPSFVLVSLILLDLMLGLGTTHAAARIDSRIVLVSVTLLHQLGAALWIGGLPAFLIALAHLSPRRIAVIGARYSTLSIAAVLTIAFSGGIMGLLYAGSWAAVYGTAYGIMMGTKSILFATMLLLGLSNFFVVRRLSRNQSGTTARLRHFVEIELGIGIAILFAATSMTTLPPAVDLTYDRVTLSEFAERLAPRIPSFSSPERSDLAVYETQKKLDDEATRAGTTALRAYTPGSGISAPRNARDIKWSEYNHHWSGLIVLVIGLLALLDQFGVKGAKYWPLSFILLAVFLFFRSEIEFWPFGPFTFAESLRDPEFIQHKLYIFLILGFAIFEMKARLEPKKNTRPKYVFPVICATAGTFLLAHSHTLVNVKELLLIEVTHIPIAIFGLWLGWTRWLELRSGEDRSWAGKTWPILFCLVGLTLLFYRES